MFLDHTGRMDAQKGRSIHRQSHEVANKHQKSSERKIKRRNCAVARQNEALIGGTDTVDVDDTEIRSSHAYSLDLSLCGYEVFGLLKKFLESKCFHTD